MRELCALPDGGGWRMKVVGARREGPQLLEARDEHLSADRQGRPLQGEVLEAPMHVFADSASEAREQAGRQPSDKNLDRLLVSAGSAPCGG